MSRWWPTAPELAQLRFVLALPSLGSRVLAAGVLLGGGVATWLLVGWPWSWAGLVLVLLGHLPLWVRGQSNAPGGATPAHEEMWLATEDDWAEKLVRREARAAAWDATPWELSNRRGCVTFGLVAVALLVGGGLLLPWLGWAAAARLAVAALLLVLPQWLNGIRTVWHPSELRLKGEALTVAREAVASKGAADDFDLVPMLALRRGRRGRYPVDARLMLRPKEDHGSGFLGVQLQVAINSVQGKDYPYLYGVVLGKEGFRLPQEVARHQGPKHRVRFVFERGKGQGATYLVIRQHADRRGGWHTAPEAIREIAAVALEEGRRALERNLGGRGR